MKTIDIPQLHKPVRIINKLNNKAITISKGQHQTKAGQIIVQTQKNPMRQEFIIAQKDSFQVYYIQILADEMALSPKSGWGDMVYSEVKLEKHSSSTSQLWRLVSYGQVMFDQKTQPKHQFEYKTASGIIRDPCDKEISNNTLKLGYQHPHSNNSNNIQPQIIHKKNLQPNIKTATHQYRPGYQFQSGPHIKAYEKIDPKDKKAGHHGNNKIQNYNQVEKQNLSSTSQPHLQVKQQKQQHHEQQYKAPKRFPVKQKNNLLQKDIDTKGWFFIQNVKYNLVLQIYGGIDEDGMKVVLNKNYGNRNQLWKLQ